MKSSEIIFSFIIPTYNRGAFLVETVGSILSERTVSIEVLIVDDGGTDNTQALIQQLNDDRIIYHKIDNRERGAARNYGLTFARGEYVNFFDSDDILNPCLANLYQFIQHHNFPNAVYGFLDLITETGEPVAAVRKSHSTFKRSILNNNFLACGAVFLKREFAETMQFSKDRMLSGTEDWELWLRVYANQNFIEYPHSIFKQRKHEGRSLNKKGAEHVRNREYAFIQHIQQNNSLLRQRFSASELALLVSDRFTLVALAESELGMKAASLKHLFQAFLKTPAVISRKRFWAVLKKLTLP